MTILKTELGDNSYPIIIARGTLDRAGEYLDLSRKAVIVTDSGVPEKYAKKIASLCKNSITVTVPEGESSKSTEVLTDLLSRMCEYKMTRHDCIIAVGGGVVGDLAGFASSIYMRGIDFYNIPTTVLSQVDSSIGGKTAVNFCGIKNIVGSFKQPKAVLIDPDVLDTLSARQVANGLAEAVKMSVTSDKELFVLLEKLTADEIYNNIEEIITRSLLIKKAVVECDEKEKGLRKILNFGHTLGHGIEAQEEMSGLYHGECVALGMIPMCSDNIKARVIRVLKKIGLPTEYHGDISSALGYVEHDKKSESDKISVIFADEIGEYRIELLSIDEFKNHILNSSFCKS